MDRSERIDCITNSWLTEILQNTSLGPIGDYSKYRLGDGTGFMNEVDRLVFHNACGGENGLDSLILKQTSDNPDLHRISTSLRTYREGEFYKYFSGTCGIGTPDCYYQIVDETTGFAMILLEDIKGLKQGDSVIGCSTSEAELVVAELARFHSRWWESSDLDGLNWIPLKKDETAYYEQSYSDGWDAYKTKADIAKVRIPRDLRVVAKRLPCYLEKIKSQLSDSPKTILHGDYRLDNCFLDLDAPSRRLVVFDWEFCCIGKGAFDIATFITESFPPTERRLLESRLLELYHSILVTHGVRNYSFEQLLFDYRVSILDLLAFYVVVGGHCNYEGERSTQYLTNQIDRLNATIADWRCTELLE